MDIMGTGCGDALLVVEGWSMAIKFECGACGRKFKARDEHAGRRSKCPACGGEIQVPMQDAWEEADLPPLPKSSAVPVALPQVRTSEDDDEPEPYRPPWRKPGVSASTGLRSDEPEPYRPPAKPMSENNRTSWRDRRGLAVAISLAVLTALLSYTAWPLAGANLNRQQQFGFSAELTTRYREGLPDHLLKTDWIEGAMVVQCDTQPARVDTRKIPWLWECEAKVLGKRRDLIERDRPAEPVTVTVRSLYWWNPRGVVEAPVECWQEVTFKEWSGYTSRHHTALSEWKPGFRSEVAAAWQRVFKEFEQVGRALPPDEHNSGLRRLVGEVAERYGISADELNEIREAQMMEDAK
jgi:hypothetical protein